MHQVSSSRSTRWRKIIILVAVIGLVALIGVRSFRSLDEISTLFKAMGTVEAKAFVVPSAFKNKYSQYIPKNKTGPNLAVMGLGQDVAKHILPVSRFLVEATKEFRVGHVVIFENDSGDATLEELQAWQRGWSNDVPVDIISTSLINMTGGSKQSRTKRLAYGRNYAWQYLFNLTENYDYVLMVDMDEVNYYLTGVEECLGLPSDWAVCCANQYTAYYDLWALRTFDHWTDCDVVFKCPDAGRNAIDHRVRHIPAKTDPFRVKSCFGGAALYSYPKIQRVISAQPNPYFGWKDGFQQCEHVSFNAALEKHGEKNASLYIQPKMLNHGKFLTWAREKERLSRDYQASFHDPLQRKHYVSYVEWLETADLEDF